MRDLQTSWRWPLSLAAALLLLLLLAAGAARYYPPGDLSHLMDTGETALPLFVMGDVVVVADEPTEPAEAPERDVPEPPPEPTLLRDLWRGYIVELAGDDWEAPAEPAPALLLPATPNIPFLALGDTSRTARLLWSAQMQNWARGRWLWEGYLGEKARKAGEVQSRKKLIFSEDWLDDAALR